MLLQEEKSVLYIWYMLFYIDFVVPLIKLPKTVFTGGSWRLVLHKRQLGELVAGRVVRMMHKETWFGVGNSITQDRIYSRYLVPLVVKISNTVIFKGFNQDGLNHCLHALWPPCHWLLVKVHWGDGGAINTNSHVAQMLKRRVKCCQRTMLRFGGPAPCSVKPGFLWVYCCDWTLSPSQEQQEHAAVILKILAAFSLNKRLCCVIFKKLGAVAGNCWACGQIMIK